MKEHRYPCKIELVKIFCECGGELQTINTTEENTAYHYGLNMLPEGSQRWWPHFCFKCKQQDRIQSPYPRYEVLRDT